ncbi:hypothetical protein ABZP36_034546 [Zizania latifolia]
MSTEDEKLLKEVKKLPWDERLQHKFECVGAREGVGRPTPSAPSPLHKPVFTTIDQLRPRMHGHTLAATVSASHTILDKPLRAHLVECLISDHIGTILFTTRNQQGTTVIFRNAKIDMFKWTMRLAVDEWGRIEVTEPANFQVKEDNNVSLIEYELVMLSRRIELYCDRLSVFSFNTTMATRNIQISPFEKEALYTAATLTRKLKNEPRRGRESKDQPTMEIAISAARWVVGRALSLVTDGVLEAWAASSTLGPNIRALKLELLYAQGMLDNAGGRGVRSPALQQLLLELRYLAYAADDVLDELDYFRIKDDLDGTYETVDDADEERGLLLRARHTTRAVAGKLTCSCSAAGSHVDDPAINEQDVDGKHGRCLAAASHTVGKRLPCFSLPSMHDNASASTPANGRRFLGGSWSSKTQQTKHAVDAPKLKFDRVKMSKKMNEIVEQLKPVCAKVATILGLEALGYPNSVQTQANDLERRPKTTAEIIEPEFYGRQNQKKTLVDEIIKGVSSGFEQLDYVQSKATLTIEGKDAWDGEFWNMLEFSNLTELQQLKIRNCPPISLDHLKMLTCLKTLDISTLSNVSLPFDAKSNAQYELSVKNLNIKRYGAIGKEFTQLLSHFSKLSRLDIRSCPNVVGLSVVEQQTMTTIPESSANKAIIRRQHQIGADLGLLVLPSHIQELHIFGCDELNLTDELLGLLSLRQLIIGDCPKLRCSGSSFPTSLQELSLIEVKGLETLQGPLPNLTELGILSCGDLRGEFLWPLLAQGHLTKLVVRGTLNFFLGSEPSRVDEQDIHHSSRLMHLGTDDFAGVLAPSICRLLSSSLTDLQLLSNNEVECFSKEQEEALQILTSIQILAILSCQKLRSLPAAGISRLKILHIFDCQAISSLDSLPDSLQVLQIMKCQAIKSLPKDDLPPSLQEIDVIWSDSEELKRQCRKLQGTIPVIRIRD